jgi:hypothetical protein
MTKYEEICKAFKKGLPRRLALSRAVEELPLRMRDALSSELGVPPELAEFLSSKYKHDIRYVYLARPMQAAHGQWTWEPCLSDDVYYRDQDGVLTFGLGLYIPMTGFQNYMLHVAVAVEDITEDKFALKIVNASGAISVKMDDTNSYNDAAKKIGQWLLDLQSDPRASLGDKASMGFSR